MYKVCLVDDEKLELNLLKNYVNWKKLGVDGIFTASNGQQALEVVRAQNPDIVFTDIRMPVMDGIEFATRLRRREKESGTAPEHGVKIIFLTGYDDMELIRKAFHLSASDYILKPFLVEDIEKAARGVIDSLKKDRVPVPVRDERLLDSIFREDSLPQDILIERFCQKKGIRQEDFSFGVAGLYGRRGSQMDRAFFRAFPEVFYYIELGDLILVLTRAGTDMEETAGRMALWLAGREAGLGVVFQKTPGRLFQARRIKEEFLQVSDAVFYQAQGRSFSLDGMLFVRKKEEFGEEEYRLLRRLRRDIVSLISRGDREGAAEKMRQYFEACEAGSAGIFRDGAVCLCYQINEELVAENQELIKFRNGLYLRSKTVSRLVEEAGSAVWIRQCVEGYVKELLEWFCSLKEDVNHRVATFVEDYIEKHYKEPVSIEELAEKIGLSPGYVRSIFKNSKGMTVKAYLSEYRLEKACSLLKNTSLGVGRIGQLVGYDNVSYFCSIFQKRYGKTPNEWRRGL